ncbi:Nose resistant to fluoxetine protein 6 [Clonorchis sinensis]|uniref:Nose resistant to fluoxetine protein 6 n=1 Tax=Clonorchis sinensis TaxID=79923 RepID=A0A3R7CF58_CLOSI|nr:Nose resistant to fluoxetine protein 6 [Clonorchis sinensis]
MQGNLRQNFVLVTLCCSSFPEVKAGATSIYFPCFLSRIAPSWFVVTIAFTGLFPYITDGPLYPQNPAAEDDLAACRDHWWVTFLNNWIHTDKPCMLWTWYLSNDYQFSVVLVPIFAALLAIHWIAGILFAVALVVSAAAATFVITYQYEYGPSPIPLKSMAHLYSAAYARWGSYAVGMILGWWLYYRPIKGTGRPFWVRCVTSMVASAAAALLTLSCLFGLYGRLHTEVSPMSNLEASLYAALSRPIWSIGIAICIYLCAADWTRECIIFLVNTRGQWSPKFVSSAAHFCITTGQFRNSPCHSKDIVQTFCGDILLELHPVDILLSYFLSVYIDCHSIQAAVNALLTFAGFRVLARLTYCAYLIHPIIIIYYGFSRGEAAHMDNTFLVSVHWSVLPLNFNKNPKSQSLWTPVQGSTLLIFCVARALIITPIVFFSSVHFLTLPDSLLPQFFTFLAVWLLSQLMATVISMCTEVPVIAMESTLRRKRSRQDADVAK